MIRNNMLKSHSGSVVAHFMVLAMLFAAGGCAHNDKPMIEGAYVPDNEVAYRRPESRLYKKSSIQENIVIPETEEISTENAEEEVSFDIQPEEAQPQETNNQNVPAQPNQANSTSPDNNGTVQKPEPAKPSAVDSKVKYTVRKGDNLWKIGKYYGISEKTIAEANGMDSKHTLQPGQILLIPAGAAVIKSDAMKPKAVSGAAKSEYIVKQGDVLSVIAQRHGVKTKDLTAANNLSADQKIFPGQKLVIPAKSETANAKKQAVAKNVKSPEKKEKTETAKKPADAKETAASAKPANAKETEAPVKPVENKDKAPAHTNSVKKSSGNEIDDLMTNTDSPAADTPASSASNIDPDDLISVRLERAMTISEIEGSYERPANLIKKLNPQLSSDVKIPAGTMVILPL